ncbi:MAG: HutD family protein [Salinivirgaceae bacterium]|jgi:environmental stress-induced protein Ves|nr:HutD family protein [Salinivirgaceae bacterium]MDD4747931.1 HutD family protein [Salinivirgaceae bacterium]MDY0280846.1 HutD family protein [Salinivirgaceae bacterium]
MQIELIKSIDFQTKKWTGGTTTELFIYPEGSTYANRDFKFRISTATIEVEESVFTSLPGFQRTILILDGKIKICHKGHYEKQLGKFDTDKFFGHWETSSIGTATDFNVMTSAEYTNDVNVLPVKNGDTLLFNCSKNENDIFLFYLLSGRICMESGEEDIMVQKGDLCVVYEFRDGFPLKVMEDSEIVVVQISE